MHAAQHFTDQRTRVHRAMRWQIERFPGILSNHVRVAQ